MYFRKCRTLEDLKKEYRKLALANHPDRGGSVEKMAAINNEYEKMFKILRDRHNATHDAAHQNHETPEEFMEVVEALQKLDGITVELCGSWLWISGDTRAVKENLKAIGCRWSNNKKLWYWHPKDEGGYHRRSRQSMEDIRSTYGSKIVSAAEYRKPEICRIR